MFFYNVIIEVLNKVKEYLNNFYKLEEYLINNYNQKERNYEILYNINEIINNNDIINDINIINNENDIKTKFNNIFNIYNKIYINEIKLNVKVEKVNIVNTPSKKKRLGRYVGTVGGIRKAVVKLADGYSINLYTEG